MFYYLCRLTADIESRFKGVSTIAAGRLRTCSFGNPFQSAFYLLFKFFS
jgi:hypothetical protein